MPMPSFPSSTLPASKWKSVAKDHDKKLGIGDALAELEKAYRALSGAAVFGVAKPDTSALAERALKEMAAAEKGALREAMEAARAASTLAKTKGAELQKKDPPAYKQLAPSLDKIVADAAAWAKALEKEAAAERAELERHFAKLKAEEAKKGDDEDDEKDDGNIGKLVERTKKVLINEVRRFEPVPGKPNPFRFCIAWAGPRAVVLAGKNRSYPEKFKALLAPQLGVAKADGFTTGEVSWDEDNKRLVFACRGKIPATNKVRLGLKKQLEKNLNVLLRKLVKNKDGKEQFEDVAEGSEDDTSAAVPASDAVADFNAELKSLSPRLMAAIKAGGRPAEEIKRLLAAANAAGKVAATAPKALGLLAQIEAIVDRLEDAGGQADAAPAGDSGELTRLRKARAEWVRLHGDFNREVRGLVAWLDEIYREEPEQKAAVAKAKKDLVTAAAKVTPALANQLDAVLGETDPKSRTAKQGAAKKALDTVKAAIFTDKILLAIDKNEQNPGLTIVSSMQASLREVEAALG